MEKRLNTNELKLFEDEFDYFSDDSKINNRKLAFRIKCALYYKDYDKRNPEVIKEINYYLDGKDTTFYELLMSLAELAEHMGIVLEKREDGRLFIRYVG